MDIMFSQIMTLKLILFWLSLVALGIVALFFFLPPLARHKKISLGLGTAFLALSFGLYHLWGAGEHIPHVIALNHLNDALEKMSHEENREVLMAQFTQLEERLSSSHAALARLGAIYYEVGLYERACPIFEQVIEMDPGNQSYLEARQECQKNLNLSLKRE